MTYQPQPITETIPHGNDPAVVVKTTPQHVSRIGFTKAVAGGVDTSWGGLVGSVGTGMAVNQTGGNLVITSGTTANSETIIRGLESFDGGVRIRARSTLSQRIVNNNFFVELVDVIGDNLAYSIGSATAITVTFPSGHGFDSSNVGQSMYLGGFSGTGTRFSGRYPIASVSGDNVTFTVAGFAVGTGTVSAFGWNYYQLHYTGTTATSANFDTQRKGYATGATAATINTTASPGHLAVITGNDLVATFADQLVATGSAIKQTIRATRDENVPDDTQLRLQLRIANGTTAPASTTTWTVGFVSVANFANQSVSINDVRPMGVGNALPVEIMRAITLAVSGTVTANQGTLVAPTPLNLNSTATTNATSVKSSAGTLYNVSASNINAAARYLKLYNKATAPTVGTDVPVLTLLLPAGATIDHDFGLVGHRFAAGIGLAITTGAADSDTGAVAASEIKAVVSYI